ncbi:MAG: glycosyl transferase [Desulfobacterales bacterium]|nr:glycosyl transferase [Desulfobacterales bacterium]
MHFFTSITANYLPKARVLAKSVKKHEPDGVFHLVLSDKVPENFNLDNEPFDFLIQPQDLNIPNLDSWIFEHSVVELCTAVKGSAFVKIFEENDADKVVYFDPDIVVLHGLEELSDILEKAGIVLTPHQVVPDVTDEAIMDNEICSLRHGVYNLGFLAARRNENGLKFIHWWRDRLLKFCYDDIPNGLFTDQKWVDLAPAFFDDIHIMRDKTYNVATWNLTHREVKNDNNGNLCIQDSPVKFFHFSGFDSGDHEIMLKKYAGNNSALFKLRKWYMQELEKEGQAEFGKLPSEYSFYSNGEMITNAQRALYRSRPDVIKTFPHPAVVTEDKLCYYYWFKETVSEEMLEKNRSMSEAEQELAIILNSKSWKLTRPLRQLAGFIRKSRGM